MLHYWDYEEFVIHSFQDSLTGSALDWFMSLKAEDIPTWADLSRKFIDQYQYCAKTPPTLLELSMKEMAQSQRFEEYATKWRAQAAKHIPPISEAPPPQGQQGGAAQPRLRKQYPSLPIPLSHIYQQLRASDKIGTIAPGPNFDPTTQDQSKQCKYHRGAPGHTLDICWRLRERIQEMIDAKELSFNVVRPLNVQANPLPNHWQTQEPSINMINICVLGEDESESGNPSPFIIQYVPVEAIVGSTRLDTSPSPFVIDIPARNPYSDNRVPWTYEGSINNPEQQFSVMGVTRSGRVYENPTIADKGKAPVVEAGAAPEIAPFPPKKALLRVLTAAQVLKETPLDRIEETVSSIFSNTISFSDDELPFEGWAHSRALHIVCRCNNYVIGRVMIDNGSALNVCPLTTLKQMNVDLNRGRPSKTAVRAFDGSRREVNGEIDLLIDIGPCSFSITFQVLDIPNAFSLLLGRPWIHSARAVPSLYIKGYAPGLVSHGTVGPSGIQIGPDRPLAPAEYKRGPDRPLDPAEYKRGPDRPLDPAEYKRGPDRPLDPAEYKRGPDRPLDPAEYKRGPDRPLDPAE
ncbi:hypothetical protein CRG98_018295 [Punica granatum]|uniref:Retrotransposon gag domain-containing protein n=1 Tax=Punica granatum TaxID=22663 RepID=A0A2I0JY89_PUNGR|nr:hypothetical protein CRG98_018295 [Punica granatum]